MSNKLVVDSSEDDREIGSSNLWLNQVAAFAGRSLREVISSWILMITAIGLPATMYLIPFIGGGDFPPAARASMSVGVGIFGAILACLYIFGNLFVVDIEDRRYAAYRSMPVSPSADLAGRMLAAIVVATAAFLSPIVVGLATGASYGFVGFQSIPIIIMAVILSCVFWMVLAIPIVIFANNERYAEWATSSVAIVALVLTGFNGVSPDISLIQGTALNYLPNTLPARLIVYHLVEGDLAVAGVVPPRLPTANDYHLVLVIYAIIALLIGIVVMKKSLYHQRGWLQ